MSLHIFGDILLVDSETVLEGRYFWTFGDFARGIAAERKR